MHFRFFPSLIEKPDKIQFENQEEDEKIELLLRAHGITNLPWILISILAFLLPLGLVQLEQFTNLRFLSTIPLQLLLGGLIIYYLLITAYIFENFLFWYYNVDIVTNKNVVDIKFNSLLSREIVEIGLEDIEIISRKSGGILDSLLNFGDVVIETAAETNNILFDNVYNPDYVVDKVQDLREKRKLFFEGEGA